MSVKKKTGKNKIENIKNTYRNKQYLTKTTIDNKQHEPTKQNRYRQPHNTDIV